MSENEILESVVKLIESFQDSNNKNRESFKNNCELVINACNIIGYSWSGSFAGYHGNLYFGNFERPPLEYRFDVEWGGVNGIPSGWRDRTPDEVRSAIMDLTRKNLNLVEFEKEGDWLYDISSRLKEGIITQLSLFPFKGEMEKEIKLREIIETYKFGIGKREVFNLNLPKQIASRDSSAVSQGIVIPTHFYYKMISTGYLGVCKAIDRFIILTDRLVKQLEVISSKQDNGISLGDLSGLRHEIYEKCNKLFVNRTYAEAVEKGFKVVRDRLRKLTGHETGSEAFGKGKIHIKGAAAPNVDKDFNAAVKFLTMSIDFFRNEKSHTSDSNIEDPVRAYEYLRLSSLAMNLLESAEIKND